MKKALSLIFCLTIALSALVGCAPKETVGASSQVTSNETADFEKPETYASVVLVTINPQFRLYLDAEGVVLAVEPVNADAKTIEKKIEFKNKKVEAVVENLVVAANDGGFIKENATVDVKIASTNNAEEKDLNAILTTVKTSVNAKLTELEVTAEVTTEVSQEILPEEETSSEETLPEENSSVVSQEPSAPVVSEKPVCKHTNKKAVSVNTGKNIIDASKLDVVNHKLVCADCKAELGTEAHKIVDSKCTLCNQKNFKTKTAGIIAADPTLEGDLKVNEDGSPAFEVMLDAAWQNAIKREYAIDEWNYKIPADAMLKAIREKFVITDAQFEKLKAQGEYKFFIDTHTFKDGYFNIFWPAAGGPGNYTHKQLGFVDNKAGKFTVYYDFMSGGPDVEEHEHLAYYAVEYSYSGYSNLSIEKGEWYNSIVGYESVVDSMRVTSIKKVASLPSNMTKI